MRIKSPQLAVVIAAAAISLCLSLWLSPRLIAGLTNATDWLRGHGLWGDLIFIGFEVLVTLAGIVPGALLGAAAGAIFGIAAGFWLSMLGILAGALLAFMLSRSFLRPWISRALARNDSKINRWRSIFMFRSPSENIKESSLGHLMESRSDPAKPDPPAARGTRLKLLNGMVTQDGWRLVALLRISPVMPFSITSYALGLTNIRPRDYVLGTLASLPLLLGYVVIGALGGMSLSARSAAGRDIHLLLLALGVAATLALTLHLSRLMARALRTA